MTEISDHLRPAGIRWLIVGILTVIVIAVLVFVSSPPEEVLRTVAVVGPDHYAGSSNDRIDFIRNLQAAAETSVVLEAVAEETGLAADQIEERLRVERVESSNLVRITYENSESNPTVAEAVVLTVPREAVGFLRTTRVAEASTRLEQATDRAEAADAVVVAAGVEVEEFETAISWAVARNANIRPDVAFDALQSELTSLRIRRAGVDAAEDPVIAEQLTAAIAELEGDVAVAALRANNFILLIAERDTAVRSLADSVDEAVEAASELDEAVIEYGLAASPPTVSLEKVEQEVGQLFPGLRRFLAVVAAALVFVIAALVAWNIAVGRRKRSLESVATRPLGDALGGGSKADQKTRGKGAGATSK